MQHKENAVLQYFQQKNNSPFSNSLETPVKELMDLNMRALQSFSYLNPTELLSMRRPEEMVEKNLEVLIENSHTALAYMQNMFNIMEKHWLNNFETSLKSTKDLTGFVKSQSQAAKTASTEMVKRVSKPSSSKTKLTATKAKSTSSSSSKTKVASGKSTLSKSAQTKSVSAKSNTTTATKSLANKLSSTSKKPMTKHASTPSKKTSSNLGSSTAKPDVSSSSRPHGSNADVKHSGNVSHSISAAPQNKPVVKELDAHKKI